MRERTMKNIAIAAWIIAILVAIGTTQGHCADYPQAFNVTTGSIDCSTPLDGTCVNLATNTLWLIDHLGGGGHDCSTYSSIACPVLPSGTQTLGSASFPWNTFYATQANSQCVRWNAANLKLQCDGTGDVTVFEDDASGQNEFQVHAPGSTAYTQMYHDATSGHVSTNSGVLEFQSGGSANVSLFASDNDAGGNKELRVYDGAASEEYISLSHDGTDGVITQSDASGAIRIDDDLFFGGATRTIRTAGGSGFELNFSDTRAPSVPLTVVDTAAGGGHDTHDTAWSANLTTDHQAIFNAINYLADNISGAATLQGAYENGENVSVTSVHGAPRWSLDEAGYSFIIEDSGGGVLGGGSTAYGLVIGGSSYDTDSLEAVKMYYDSATDMFAIENRKGATSIIRLILDTNEMFAVSHDVSGNVQSTTLHSGNGVILKGGTALSEAGYEGEVTSNQDLLVRGNNTKLTSANNTIIDSGSITTIGSSGTGSATVVEIGSTSDRDALKLYGPLVVSQYGSGPHGSATFSDTVAPYQKTITCTSCTVGSSVFVMPTSQPSGTWWITKSSGSFTVNSSASEASTTFDYLAVNP